MAMKYDVFISYSRKDYDEVSGILQSIKGAIPGISCWFDIDGIESGDEFEDKIISAIDNSTYLLFALSENSIQSKWTKDEVMYARNTGKKIIPVLLKDAQLKGWFLFKFGNVDCIDSTNALQLEKLLHNLSNWTGKNRVVEKPVVEKNDEPLCPCGSGKLFKDCHGQPSAVSETYAQKPIERTWKVGDFYDVDGKKGVVFWVDETGKHGKIVSMDEAKLTWCSNLIFYKNKVTGDTIYSDGRFSLYDGAANMNAIKAIGEDLQNYPAISWCLKHGDAWYLPAIEELTILFSDAVYTKVNRTLSSSFSTCLMRKGRVGYYWSSTIGVKNCIRPWIFRIADCNRYLKDGIENCAVRAVTTF